MTTTTSTAEPPVLDIVIPVFNEENDLAPNVHRLRAYLDVHLPMRCRITIADNASTDATLAVAQRVSGDLADVHVVHLPAKGRGGALNTVWSSSEAAVLAYPGRRPVHGSGRALAAGRAAALRPFRRRDRQPAGPRGSHRPRTEA